MVDFESNIWLCVGLSNLGCLALGTMRSSQDDNCRLSPEEPLFDDCPFDSCMGGGSRDEGGSDFSLSAFGKDDGTMLLRLLRLDPRPLLDFKSGLLCPVGCLELVFVGDLDVDVNRSDTEALRVVSPEEKRLAMSVSSDGDRCESFFLLLVVLLFCWLPFLDDLFFFLSLSSADDAPWSTVDDDDGSERVRVDRVRDDGAAPSQQRQLSADDRRTMKSRKETVCCRRLFLLWS